MALQLRYKYHELIQRVLDLTTVCHPQCMNPNLNFKEYFLQQQSEELLTSKSEEDLWYWLSKNPSNFAIQMMMKNLHKINHCGLLSNTNPKIEILLEKKMFKFGHNDWRFLCKSHNPAAMSFLQKHLKKIDWYILSANQSEGAIRILENNLDKVVWHVIAENPSAISIIEANMEQIELYALCKNPNAIHLIEQNIAQLTDNEFEALSCNPNAVHILKANQDKISRFWFSENPNAISILESNHQLIDFSQLVRNPNAISLLENNIAQLTDYDIESLIHNPNAIPLFQRIFDMGLINQEDFNYLVSERLQTNASLFDLDYQEMSKARTKFIYSELMSKALDPSRVEKWLTHHLQQGYDIIDFEIL